MATGVAAEKDKMAKALGAAFLQHQVNQLEEKVNNTRGGRSARGGGQSRGRGGGKPNGNSQDTNNGRRTANASASQGARLPNKKQSTESKVADRVVLDASVLIHSLSQLKRWCSPDRKEIIIVPLEALNTIDLLKKGSSPVAMRARAASRLLEEQVGSNPRIKVQGDLEYVPWDTIDISASRSPTSSDDSRKECPDWMMRTVCSAKWEAMTYKNQEVVFAVSIVPDSAASLRYESRASGSIAKDWAERIGLKVLNMDAPSSTETRQSRAEAAVKSDDEELERGADASGSSGGIVTLPVARIDDEDPVLSMPMAIPGSRSPPVTIQARNDAGRAKTLYKPNANGDKHDGPPPSPTRNKHHRQRGSHGKSSGIGQLVDKPPTITPSGLLTSGKVIRVLARGEKLDP